MNSEQERWVAVYTAAQDSAQVYSTFNRFGFSQLTAKSKQFSIYNSICSLCFVSAWTVSWAHRHGYSSVHLQIGSVAVQTFRITMLQWFVWSKNLIYRLYLFCKSYRLKGLVLLTLRHLTHQRNSKLICSHLNHFNKTTTKTRQNQKC